MVLNPEGDTPLYQNKGLKHKYTCGVSLGYQLHKMILMA